MRDRFRLALMAEAALKSAVEDELYLLYLIQKALGLSTEEILEMPNSRYMVYRGLYMRELREQREAMKQSKSPSSLKTFGGV